MAQTLSELTQQFSIPGVHFDDQAGGLIRATVRNDVASGELFLLGAHCTRWHPTGQAPVLWMSRESLFQPGKPIRGGVPICFPWFGAHATDPSAPGHGSARLKNWDLKHVSTQRDGAVSVILTTHIAPFDVQYAIEFGQTLKLSLATSLPASHTRPERFEDALHTYLCVSDIHQVSISGLESVPYSDKMANGDIKPPAQSPIVFTCETDRVYSDTDHTCVLHDPGLSRRVSVHKSGSQSSVIWNPWIAKSARMPDFGDDEWTGMLCIETANVGHNAIVLQPGGHHTTTAELTVEKS
ncbi:MAG: D-hexose-6-phosphate mutarotase [Pirellulaceae bacterium]|nr:D-hexose-6-phosphate mutarotase [Pirellulaceae bacterium]